MQPPEKKLFLPFCLLFWRSYNYSGLSGWSHRVLLLPWEKSVSKLYLSFVTSKGERSFHGCLSKVFLFCFISAHYVLKYSSVAAILHLVALRAKLNSEEKSVCNMKCQYYNIYTSQDFSHQPLSRTHLRMCQQLSPSRCCGFHSFTLNRLSSFGSALATLFSSVSFFASIAQLSTGL